MSDTITSKQAPETAPEQDNKQAPETAPATPPAGPVDLQTFLTLEGAAVDATVDVDAFSKGVSAIVAQVPEVKRAEGVYNAARYALAQAIITCRNAVTINGKPDTFGASKIYKRLFGDWIVSQVLAANPTMDVVSDDGTVSTVPTDRTWIRKELDYVRINYLGDSATRAKGLLFESVIRDAAESGKIPGAKVAKDGTITAPVFTRKKDANGNLIPKVEKVTKDGETKEIPVLAVYKPGQQVDVPSFAKAEIAKVIAERAPKKKDPETKAMVSTVNVPVRFGGAETEKGSGGGKPKGPEDYAKAFRGALDTLTDASDNLAVGPMLEWFHAAASHLCETLNRKDLTGAGDHAKVLANVAKLLHAEAALLTGNSTATLEKVAALMFTPPETAPEQDAEKDADGETDGETDNS